MTGRGMSVRGRLTAALTCGQPDRVPCAMMIFAALRQRCRTEEEFVRRQLELRLDTFVHLGHLPMAFHPAVKTSTAKDRDPDGGVLLRKTYATPAGNLTAVVRQTEDWPYGDDVPLFDDYLIPRSAKFLVTGKADLPALRFLFGPFRDEDVANYRRRAKELAAFARQQDLPTVAGWGRGGNAGVMGLDAAMWLAGMESLIFLAHDEPQTVDELAAIIAEWNRRQLEVVLEPAPDLVIRRAWYETTEFWTPGQYARFIQPALAAEAALVHQADARYGYIITSAMMPLIPHLLAAGVDVIVGVDPVQGKGTDVAALKSATVGRAALWGGVNGFLTVELGTEQEVVSAVESALSALAPGGGFILSPVDNLRADTPQTWANLRTLIATCHAHGSYA